MRYICGGLIALFGVFPSAWQPVCAAEKPTIKQIIEKVQANERRYKNIDVTFDYNNKDFYDKQIANKTVKPRAKAKRPAKKVEEAGLGRPGVDHLVGYKIRFVQNDQKFYFKAERAYSLDQDEEKIVRRTTTTSYDGKQTRVLNSDSGNNHASIHHTRYLHWEVHLPMTFLNNWNSRTLSRHLQIPNIPRATYHWRVLSRNEKVDGLVCVKLQLESVSVRTGAVSIHKTLWLAVDRNYQPVKTVEFRPQFSVAPHAVSRVTKFKQLKPGVWLPSKTVTTVYNIFRAPKNGKRIVVRQESFTLRKAKLNARLNESLFTSLKFPKGTQVNEYRDGNKVISYRQN